MRERMFATLGIWAAVAFMVDRLLNALTYTVWTEGAPQQYTGIDGTVQSMATQIANIQYVEGITQFAIFAVIFLALACAAGATVAVWQTAQENHEHARVAIRESHKTKRDREARVQRLLSQMDEDDIAALEEQHIGNDGEQMTVAQLMQQKRGK